MIADETGFLPSVDRLRAPDTIRTCAGSIADRRRASWTAGWDSIAFFNRVEEWLTLNPPPRC